MREITVLERKVLPLPQRAGRTHLLAETADTTRYRILPGNVGSLVAQGHMPHDLLRGYMRTGQVSSVEVRKYWEIKGGHSGRRIPEEMVVGTPWEPAGPDPSQFVYVAGRGLVPADHVGEKHWGMTTVLEGDGGCAVERGEDTTKLVDRRKIEPPLVQSASPAVSADTVLPVLPAEDKEVAAFFRGHPEVTLPDETTHWALISNDGAWFGKSFLARWMCQIGVNPLEGKGYVFLDIVRKVRSRICDFVDDVMTGILKKDIVGKRMDELIALSHADSAKQRRISEELGYATKELVAVR